MPAPPPSATSPAPSPQGVGVDAEGFDAFLVAQDPVDAVAAGWLVRELDGLTAAEEAQRLAWERARPEHARAIERLRDLWGRMDGVPQEGIDALRTGSALREPAMGLTPAATAPPWGKGLLAGLRTWLPERNRWVPQLAVAAAAFFVGAGGWTGWEAWQARPTFTQSFASVRGQQQQVRLPDGSTLWLDTSTQADVAFYRQHREVRLRDGQALFAVSSDAQRPFDVLAGPLRITVVGTRFLVRHTRDGLGGGVVSVEVEEGRVRVARQTTAESNTAPRSEEAPIELTAGEAVAASADGTLGAVQVRTVGTGSQWREGRVNFDDVPLSEALAEFERYGDTHVVVRDPAVAALRLSGSFDLRHFDAFARALPQVLPVRLRQQGAQVEVVSARE